MSGLTLGSGKPHGDKGAQWVAKCTPSLGDVSIWWSRATESIMWENNLGQSIFYLRDGVGGEVAEVRNGIVEAVLNESVPGNECLGLFWVDDDVLCFPGAFIELLHQERDICSGVYFTKLEGNLSSPLIYPVRGAGPDRYRPCPDDCIDPRRVSYPVWGHGMGLTFVRTEVYRRMERELNLPRDKYGRPQWHHKTVLAREAKKDPETGVIGLGFTEDTYFLDQAARCGFQPWIVNTKHAFGFHYDKDKDVGYPSEQWKQWISGDKITWHTPEGDVVWE